MPSTEDLLRLKAYCLASGVRLEAKAAEVLSHRGEVPLTVHEYATTGGVTVRAGDFYLNAPFDDWYCARSEVELVSTSTGGFALRHKGVDFDVEVLPLPGYLGAVNARGERADATTMTHADRIRVSPITGCALDCHFCDFPALRYTRHDPDEVVSSIQLALVDTNLPPAHMLISGGSPGPRHFDWFDDTLATIASRSDLPVDVMMSPREGSVDHVRRLVEAGVSGFALNLEIFGAARAGSLMPRKHRTSSPYAEKTIEAAVEALGGGTGRVRSLIIVGLDEPHDTLSAVEFVAGLGCDPVLSPFRPARDTRLEHREPPSVELLLEVHHAADAIARRHGVGLGPRCIPCQHNTLVLPDGTDDYWFSGEHSA